MMVRLISLLALLAVLTLPAHGQSVPGASPPDADALFHQAAQRYIDGNASQARQLVERGLDLNPDHPRLRALKKKLEEQQRQRQQTSGSQQNQSQQNQQRSNQQQSGQQQQKKQQQQNQRQQGQNQQDDSDEQQDRQQAQQQQSQQQSSQQQRRSPQPNEQAAHKLSRAQAERILQAMRNQEKQLLRQAQKRDRRHEPTAKDW